MKQEIPLTASSTTSTTRSICWTWKNRHTREESIDACKPPRPHSQQTAAIDNLCTHTHWSTPKYSQRYRAVRTQRFNQIQSRQVFLPLAISDMDFLNATEYLCSCNTNYQVWLSDWKKNNAELGGGTRCFCGYIKIKKKHRWSRAVATWVNASQSLDAQIQGQSGLSLCNKPYKLKQMSHVLSLTSLNNMQD